jgi:hypothetical protein
VETLAKASLGAPVAPSDPAWDAAFLRVESYLRAHHIESRVLLNRLATEIIRRTRALAENQPADEIINLAMKVAHAQIGQWFARIFPDGDWSDERLRARGRLALLLTDMPGKWSQHFLSPEPLPEELAEAMRTCVFQAGPELRFTNMPPTSIDSILGDDVDPARAPSKRFPMMKTILGSLLVAGLAGIAWAAFL